MTVSQISFSQFVLDHSGESVFWIGSDAQFLYVNKAACRSLGYSREELLSLNVDDINPGFSRELWPDHWTEVKQRGSLTRESYHRTKNGRVFPVEIMVDFLEFDGREYYCAFARDITERKQTQQARRESEEAMRASEVRFRTLAANSSDVINLFSAEGRVLYTSPSIMRVLGYEPEERIGTEGLTLLHPDDVEPSMAFFDKCLQAPGAVTQSVCRLRHKDGSYRTVEVTGTNLLNEPGFHAMVSIFHDITEQRQAEEALQRAHDEMEERVKQRTQELATTNLQLRSVVAQHKTTEMALRESQENLQTLFNTLDDFLFVLDQNGRILDANPAAAKGLGFSQEALRGMAALDFRPADQREEAAAILADIVDGKANVCDLPLVRKDGTLIHVETRATRGKWGERDAVFGISRDISDRLDAERELRCENAFRSAVIKRAAEGLCVCHDTPEYPFVQFTVWNNRMTEITGYTMEEINQLGWYQTMYPSEEVQQSAKERMHLMRKGVDLRGEEWTITRGDGEKRTVRISTSILENLNNTVYVLAMMQDITEMKRAEEQSKKHLADLAHVARLSTMGEMASGMAHEINQPLAAIATYADTCQQILGECLSPTDIRVSELLAKIVKQVDRCSEIIRRLRTFVRKTAPNRAPVDLNHLVRELIELVETEARHRHVRLGTNLDRSIPPLLIDGIQIQQVLLNLVTNAFDAVVERESDQRNVLIGTSAMGLDNVEVSVRDSGKAIAPENAGRVFHAYFTTKPDGMGMGLAIAQSIVEAHSGRIWTTPNEDHGSTFRFTLPIVRKGKHSDDS